MEILENGEIRNIGIGGLSKKFASDQAIPSTSGAHKKLLISIYQQEQEAHDYEVAASLSTPINSSQASMSLASISSVSFPKFRSSHMSTFIAGW